MEDRKIIDLYWRRDELAIQETDHKYGRYCYAIANNILSNQEDSEESVSETYWRAWDSMPPHRPDILSAFLGKITRRISLNIWRSRSRIKRGGGEIALALEELADCVASDFNVEQSIEQKELSLAIDGFLAALPRTERDVFVSRYWFLASVQEISTKFNFSQSKTKSMLFRTRNKLKKHLQEENLI